MHFRQILRKLRDRWFGIRSGRAPRRASGQARRPRSVSLAVETLEGRVVPATDIWTGLGANVNWDNPANWSIGVPNNGDDVVFAAGVPIPSKTNTNNITGLTLNSITFADSGYTLNGQTLNLGTAAANTGFVIANLGATNNTINFNIQMSGAAGNRQFFTVGTTSAVLTVNGQLQGSTGVEFSKDGPGTLILTANNSLFTGPITIVEGALNIRNANALATTDSPTTVLSTSTKTGQLQVENVAGPIAEPLILNGPGPLNDGALLNVAGNNTWTGGIILDSNSYLGSNAGSLVIQGVITDLGAGH